MKTVRFRAQGKIENKGLMAVAEECLICKAPLEYLEKEELMECSICHKKEASKTRCIAGHYICEECHMQGVDSVIGVCLSETQKDPYKIFRRLADLPFCHMHGPEHHIMVGSALLTAYKNSGGNIDLPEALIEMQSRGKQIPGGACGFWGACGAGISSGIFVSVITKATPLSGREWGLSNRMTARALEAIGRIGGPRYCKRNSSIAITEAVKFISENFSVDMELSPIVCKYYEKTTNALDRGVRSEAPVNCRPMIR